MTRRRWIQIDGELREVDTTYRPRPRKGPHIIGDFTPYKAVTGDMEGQWITSRRAHREFLRRNALIEVGNEYDYMTRHGGMTEDNPNLKPEHVVEEEICKDLAETLEQIR